MTSPDLPLRRAAVLAPRRATVTSLRRHNRALVLTHVVLAGQTSRADIARDCGLSLASATNLVSELAEEGLVEEVGTVSSQGGRPITLVAPDRTAPTWWAPTSASAAWPWSCSTCVCAASTASSAAGTRRSCPR
ncbi:helix-turn-helix domain-containing protein [Cellulomonas soli]